MKLKNYLLPAIFGLSSLTSCNNYNETQNAKIQSIEKIPKIETHYDFFGNPSKKDTTYNYLLYLKTPQGNYELTLKTNFLKKEFIEEKINKLEKLNELKFTKRTGMDKYVSEKTHKGYNYLLDILRLNKIQ